MRVLPPLNYFNREMLRREKCYLSYMHLFFFLLLFCFVCFFLEKKTCINLAQKKDLQAWKKVEFTLKKVECYVHL